MKELKVALMAAKEAGKFVKESFSKNFKIYTKKDSSPVTDIDRKTEKIIVSRIKKYFPNHNFLGEEFSYKKTGSEYKWIIDPIDGTKQFIRNIPFYGTSIGLERKGRIIAGVINLPSMNMLCYAAKGKGSFVNGKRIKVSNKSKIEDSYVTFGDLTRLMEMGYTRNFLNIVKKCNSHRGYGDLLGFLYLAQGKTDFFIDTNKPWDVAAAKIIVEEAGGKMTDLNGKDSIYSGHTIASNGKFHDKIVQAFRK